MRRAPHGQRDARDPRRRLVRGLRTVRRRRAAQGHATVVVRMLRQSRHAAAPGAHRARPPRGVRRDRSRRGWRRADRSTCSRISRWPACRSRCSSSSVWRRPVSRCRRCRARSPSHEDEPREHGGPVRAHGVRRADATREIPDLRPSRAVAVSDWLVRRTSSFLASRSSRRGFLIGSAVTGSAVTAAGVKFATRPGTAYAAITDCPPGSACLDGYTEFCCTINAGQNTCPPGSFAGGWWRADFSTFCNGTRYYIDCMQNCCGPRRGDGFCSGCVECQCGGGCDKRKVYCNYFRYGQCHQEIAESGPIACRVVTCVPPYATDPSCTPVSAVDNATAEHTAACLTTPAGIPTIIRRKGRNVIQVSLYGTPERVLRRGRRHLDPEGVLAPRARSPTATAGSPLGSRPPAVASRAAISTPRTGS